MSSGLTEKRRGLREYALWVARECLHTTQSTTDADDKVQRLDQLSYAGTMLEYRRSGRFKSIPRGLISGQLGPNNICDSDLCMTERILNPKSLWHLLGSSIEAARKTSSVENEYPGHLGRAILEDAASDIPLPNKASSAMFTCEFVPEQVEFLRTRTKELSDTSPLDTARFDD